MIYSRLQESLIFSRLPDDVTEKRKFSKLFKELNKFLESARVQGFVWEKRDYEFEDDNGNKDIVTLLFDENIYNILLRRYKELRTVFLIAAQSARNTKPIISPAIAPFMNVFTGLKLLYGTVGSTGSVKRFIVVLPIT